MLNEKQRLKAEVKMLEHRLDTARTKEILLLTQILKLKEELKGEKCES